MSIPRTDPNFTTAQLRAAGDKFLAAAYEYWEATHLAGMNLGSVIWVQDTDGRLAIFTRGEYRHTLMNNIDSVGEQIYEFGTAGAPEE